MATSPRIAVTMGIDIATAVPKANSRMTIAAAMPITSLISVPCWETSVPR